jgi:predicted kinase
LKKDIKQYTHGIKSLKIGVDCPMKVLYIVRGLPGSGKSTHVNNMIENEYSGNGLRFSTNDYFIENGFYHFRPKLVRKANRWNLDRAHQALKNGQSPIFIDNPHVQRWEAKKYVTNGLFYGYKIKIIEPETTWWKKRDLVELAFRNKHGVSYATIQKMLLKWDYDFSIISILNSADTHQNCSLDVYQKRLYLIRGAPGSGRFCLAERINQRYFQNEGYIFSSRDYFIIDDKNYKYDPYRMTEALIWNQKRVEACMEKNIGPIFLIEPFPRANDCEPYIKLASYFKYSPIILEPNTWWWVERNVEELTKRNTESFSKREIEEIIAKWAPILQ